MFSFVGQSDSHDPAEEQAGGVECGREGVLKCLTVTVRTTRIYCISK